MTPNFNAILTIGILLLMLLLLMLRLMRILAVGHREQLKLQKPHNSILLDTLRVETLRGQVAERDSHEAREAYASLLELYQTVMEHLPVGVLVTDRSAHLQFANPSACLMLDLDSPQNECLRDVCPPLFQAFILHAEATHIGPVSFHLGYGVPERSLAISLGTLPQQSFLFTIKDVTRVKHLEERVRTKRDLELMGEMASGITHELKNALATISGHVQMLPYGSTEEHADHIMVEVDNLLRFIQQFMKTSQGEQLHPEPLNLQQWFAELSAYWQSHPLGKTVVFEPVPSEELIFGERSLLVTMLNNLVLNGLQSVGADQRPPAVHISAEISEQGNTLVVADEGLGFSAEVRARIFVPFVSSKVGGTGLGLFQCRKIMMEHQGRLELDHGKPTRILCHFPKHFVS